MDGGVILVLRERGLLHRPGPNPGTPFTVCGLDAGGMVREERPDDHAGIWCQACWRAEVVVDLTEMVAQSWIEFYREALERIAALDESRMDEAMLIAKKALRGVRG